MKQIALSIVTATLNSEAYFRECLESIHGQASATVDIEHIVVDGGSTDATVEMARSFPCVIVQDEDDGLYDAMNIGVDRAEGDVVMIVNSDDVLLPGAAEAIARWYVGRRSEWAIGGLRWMDVRGRPLADIAAPPAWMSVPVFASLGWNCAHHGATLVTRSFHDEVGRYDTSYEISADYEFLARALALQPFDRLNETLSGYRRHAGSASVRGTAAIAREGERIAARYGPAGFRRRLYAAALRLWLNASNPGWLRAKYLGRA